jgi:fumarate hydratase class II
MDHIEAVAPPRIERDSMGEVQVPAAALWGAQTQRALQNFPASGLTMPQALLRAMGLIKFAAAAVNAELGDLPAAKAAAIQQAALEVAKGGLEQHFPVDLFQTVPEPPPT